MTPLARSRFRNQAVGTLVLAGLGLACTARPVCAQQVTPAEQIALKSMRECSLSKTNKSCKLVIDRANPVAPSTVQMYSGEALIVVVEHPLPFERYFLDFTTGQAAVTPDVASSIVQGLFPYLKSVQGIASSNLALEYHNAVGATPTTTAGCEDPLFRNPAWPPVKGVQAALPNFQACFSELATKAISAYKALEPLVAPDSLTPASPAPEPSYYRHNRQDILRLIQDYVNSESIVSTKIGNMAKGGPGTPVYNADDQILITQLGVTQKILDAVSSDLLGYSQRITDLGACGYGYPADKTGCGDAPLPDVSLSSRADDEKIYEGMVTRTITYSLDSLNLVSYSQEAVPAPTNKKALATIAINFGDSATTFPGFPFTALRWEASAGVFFSTLPNRSFSVDSSGVVHDSKTRPTTIPFAAANYRLTGDLRGRWKSNFYWTGAIGVNPNNTSAEYGTGISYAWRALMVSALCHFGHDTRPISGTTTGGTTGALQTTAHWTEAFAVGISVRVPSLTGR